MKITWLTTWKDIQDESFLKEWNVLLGGWSCPHVFFTQPLCKAWLDTYRPIRNLLPRFLLLEDGESKLLWPLVLWRQNWRNAFRRMLVAVGHSDYDYAEPIVIGNRNSLVSIAIDAIQDHAEEWDAVAIHGLTQVISNARQEVDYCPFCKLGSYIDGEDFLKKAKKSLREDVRRQRKRLGEQGDMSLVEAPLPLALQELSVFLQEHHAHWPKAYKAPNFHENLLKTGLPTGLVRFDILRVNEISVAWHLGFHCKGRFYYYMPAANREWLAFSPNKLLLFELLGRSITEKDEIFDHLRGAENYKRGWTNDILNLWKINEVNTQSFGAIIRNGLYECRDALMRFLKKNRGGYSM